MGRAVTVNYKAGAVEILKDYKGHVLTDVASDDGTHTAEMPRQIVLEFSDTVVNESDLLTIEEQEQVLRCFRQKAMFGNQDAYSDLHITLGRRFCPDVDGANQP